jgi:hypothetical protein
MVSVVRVGLDIVRSRDMEEAQDESMLAGVVGVGAPSVAGEKKRCTLAWLFARLVDGNRLQCMVVDVIFVKC